MTGRYRYTVRFTGVESTPKRIKRRATKLRDILADSTPEAIDRARGYLVEAGKQASQRYENTAAINYFTRALNLTAENDLRARFDLLLARSRRYDTRGERELERPDLLAMEQLAEALGVHYQTIGYLERGEYHPSLALALRVAAALDVSVESLFSLTPFE